MPYIVKDDFTLSIQVKNLDAILAQAAQQSGRSTADILDTAVDTAMAEVRSYLGKVYDMGAEFAKDSTDGDRAPLIVRHIVNISLYQIHFTVSARDVPEHRGNAYVMAREDLEKMRDEEMDPGVPYLVDEVQAGTGRNTIRSHRKFISRPFTDSSLFED